MLSNVQSQDEGVAFLRCVVADTLKDPLLLVGESGVGRRFSVLEAAKEAFCKHGEGEDCVHCVQIDKNVHPDFLCIRSTDGRDIGVDTIRGLINQAYSFPTLAKRRFILIDGVDRMTPAAANALLKTLEEPPRKVRFFLLAEESIRVLPTIRSRCGLVRYRPLPEDFVVARVRRFEKDEAKALVYARLAEGSLGRAIQFKINGRLRLRDQVVALLQTGLRGDLSSLFSSVDDLGTDLALGCRFLNHVLHDLVMVDHEPSRLTNVDLQEQLVSMKANLGVARLARLRAGYQVLEGRRHRNVNLPFHVKTFLADSFVD